MLGEPLKNNKEKQGRPSKAQNGPVKPSQTQWLAWLNEQNKEKLDLETFVAIPYLMVKYFIEKNMKYES